MDKMRSSPQRTRASAGSQGLAMGGGGGDRLVLASSSGDRSTEVLGPWMRGVGQAQGRVKVGGLAVGEAWGGAVLCRVPAVLGGTLGYRGALSLRFCQMRVMRALSPGLGVDGRAPCLTVTQPQKTWKLDQTPSVFCGSAGPTPDTGLHKRAWASRGEGPCSRPRSAGRLACSQLSRRMCHCRGQCAGDDPAAHVEGLAACWPQRLPQGSPPSEARSFPPGWLAQLGRRGTG